MLTHDGVSVPTNAKWFLEFSENQKKHANSLGPVMITPEMSVRKLLAIIARCTSKDSGRFIRSRDDSHE
jgi:hypothetical protein